MEYVEPGISLTKLYHMYRNACLQHGTPAQKISMYRQNFNSEFNMGFHIPKKVRCDLCEEYKVRSNYNTLSKNEYQKTD